MFRSSIILIVPGCEKMKDSPSVRKTSEWLHGQRGNLFRRLIQYDRVPRLDLKFQPNTPTESINFRIIKMLKNSPT